MAKVKMSDYVEYNGESYKLSELDEMGMLEFKHVYEDNDMWGEKPKNYYYALIKGTDFGWDIRKTAYFSRTKQKEKLKEIFN